MSKTNQNKNNFFDKEPKEFCQKKFNQIDQKLDDLQKAVAEMPSAEIDETIVNNLETLTETVGDISDAVTQNSQDISTLQTSKQNTLTAGANISISGNTISATDTTYSAGSNITISNNVISATDTTYTAGNNVTISDGIISATDTTYTAGTGLSLSGTTFSADTTTLATKTDLAQKQDVLTAGSNISINNGTISATDTTYTAGTGISISAQNVISATGGGGLSEVTASNVDSESATSGQVLTADGNGGASWQNVSGGSGSSGGTEIDYAYNPQPITLDPNDTTIYQNYAKFSRRYNKSFNGVLTTCYFVFSANANSTGLLRLKIKFTASQTFAGTVALFNNDVQVATTSISYQNVNLNQTMEVEFSNLTLADGNVFYATITPTPYNAIVKLLNLEAELFAPNAEVINQISPFSVEYYDGKYYIGDYSSATAKIAEINANAITSVNDLVWVDTGIECYGYKVSFNHISDNGVFVVNDRIDYYKTYDNVSHFKNRTTDVELTIPTDCEVSDWVPCWTTNYVKYSSICLYPPMKLVCYTQVNGTFTNASFVDYYKPYGYAICTSKLLVPQNSNLRVFGNLVIPNQNILASCLSNSKSAELVLGKGTYPHSYIIYQDYANPNLCCYAKLYGKIIRYDYTFTWGTKSFTLNSTTEIGPYEEYFEGANNDYFVVKNGNLEYHKKPISA